MRLVVFTGLLSGRLLKITMADASLALPHDRRRSLEAKGVQLLVGRAAKALVQICEKDLARSYECQKRAK